MAAERPDEGLLHRRRLRRTAHGRPCHVCLNPAHYGCPPKPVPVHRTAQPTGPQTHAQHRVTSGSGLPGVPRPTQSSSRARIACSSSSVTPARRRPAGVTQDSAGTVPPCVVSQRGPAKLSGSASVAQWKSSSVLRKGLGVRVPPGAPRISPKNPGKHWDTRPSALWACEPRSRRGRVQRRAWLGIRACHSASGLAYDSGLGSACPLMFRMRMPIHVGRIPGFPSRTRAA